MIRQRQTNPGWLVLVACVIGMAGAAFAMDGDPEWIRPEAVPGRADALLTELETAKPSVAQQEKLLGVERSFGELVPRLDALNGRIETALAGDTELEQLEDLRRELVASVSPLTTWHAVLEAETQRLSGALDRIQHAHEVWSATLSRAETAEADAAVARRVRASLQLLEEGTVSLRAWRDRVLALHDRVLERRTSVTSVLARLEATAKVERKGLLVPDRPPLWRTGYTEALRREQPRIFENVGGFVTQNRDYLLSDPRPLIAQLVLIALLAVVLRQAAPRARQRAALTPELADAARVLERPIAIATLLVLLATPWLQPLAPRRFIQVMALVALIAVARVVSHTSRESSGVALASLFGLLLLDRLALAVEELPTVAQTLFLIELGLGLFFAIHVARRGGLVGRGLRWVRNGARVAAVALAIALAAEVGGWGQLARLLGGGAIVAALTAVFVWAAVTALDALLVWTLHSPRWGRLLRGGRFARRLVRWLGIGVWLYLLVVSVGQRDWVAQLLGRILDAGISVGALSLTLGGVLVFALTLAASPFIARAIVVVLEEGVYPRAHLSRGMPYALSTMVRYAVYSFAFIAALAAAGVHLSQLSILLGGLGVGVGLGLQDFVKNFAAGLTLLFERRVHVGDVVQIPSREIFGRVLQIGMRAVMVRNWDGAEVIVPNMDLISGAVTNWTLSDQQRRIEIPVGAAYGTDPEQVISLLLGVARAHEDVLEHPPPLALFQGFGESSLDFVLRSWTDRDYDRTSAIRSELALGIHRSLSEAGIEIPFPQRDLHVASVSASVRAALAGKDDD